jgi:N,N'-diacetyllegionaminate synthase
VPVGFSDHTNGITVAIAAAALGASVIEKHLTLDRNADGPDHKASITPRELQALRIALIEVEAAMGDGIKRVMPCEEKLYAQWRGH